MTAVIAPVFWMTEKAPPTMKRIADDRRGLDESPGRRDEEPAEALGSALDPLEGTGDGDRPAVLFHPLVFAAGDDPGGDDGQDDHGVDQDEGVGELQLFHGRYPSTVPVAGS